MNYHVNPLTGVPTICRAESGSCPYGGASGKENHFNTYSKAQAYALNMFNSKRQLLEEDTDEVLEEIERRKVIKKEEVETLVTKNLFHQTKAIRFSEDPKFIMAIIEREVNELSRWAHISAALQNPHISKKFLEDALYHYPKQVDGLVRGWLILNDRLTHDELVSIIENTDESMGFRLIALRNPNLHKEYIQRIIEDPDRLVELPYLIIINDYKDVNEEVEQIRKTINMYELEVKMRPVSKVAKAYVRWEIKFKKFLAQEGL